MLSRPGPKMNGSVSSKIDAVSERHKGGSSSKLLCGRVKSGLLQYEEVFEL